MSHITSLEARRRADGQKAEKENWQADKAWVLAQIAAMPSASADREERRAGYGSRDVYIPPTADRNRSRPFSADRSSPEEFRSFEIPPARASAELVDSLIGDRWLVQFEECSRRQPYYGDVYRAPYFRYVVRW